MFVEQGINSIRTLIYYQSLPLKIYVSFSMSSLISLQLNWFLNISNKNITLKAKVTYSTLFLIIISITDKYKIT